MGLNKAAALAGIAAILGGLPAMAQETSPSQAVPATSPASPPPGGGAAAAAPDGSGASAASGQATAEPKVTAETFQDWRLECYDPAVNGMKCQLVQQLVERNLEQVVLVTSLAYAPAEKRTQIQMVLPVGFMLKRGVTMEIGDYKSTIAVDRCTAQGCFVEGEAAPELIAAMRRANSAQVSIVADTGQQLNIPFSLMGFTRAFQKMETENAAFQKSEAKTSGG